MVRTTKGSYKRKPPISLAFDLLQHHDTANIETVAITMAKTCFTASYNDEGHHVFEISDPALAALVMHVLEFYDGRLPMQALAPAPVCW